MANRYTRRPTASKARLKADISSRLAEVTVDRLGARGDAIAQDHGDRLYIPFAVPGDRVKVRTLGKQGDGLSASLVEILTASPHRIDPVCAHFGQCGGCALQQVDAETYGAWKLEVLTEPLRRVGIDLQPLPLRQAPTGSRRRVQLAFHNRRGVCELGFHQRATHKVVDIAACAVLLPEIVALFEPLRGMLAQLIVDGSGEATVTAAETGLDVLIEGPLTLDLFTRQQLAAFAEARDLARLSWRRPGDETEPVARRRPALIRFGKNGVEPPPGSFIQPTRFGEQAIAGLILEAIPAKGKVADLYAGCGSFSVPLAERGNQVHAVEGEALPLRALAAAANQAGLAITTETRDLARRPLLPHELKPYDAVLFDPPRAGAIEQAQNLADAGPPTVVAVSCNPNTLARDLKVLIAGGYRLRSITPIDQFPFTAHLECVAVLER